jgi:hypothetical protein
MLKSTSDGPIKIYEIYVNRITKEGDWFWTRFNIYFGFNSGALIIIGFLFKSFLEKRTLIEIPVHISIIGCFFSFIGILFAIVWFFITKDGIKWQDKMNDVIVKLEKEVFSNYEMGLYNSILDKKVSGTKKDVVYISLVAVRIFILAWSCLLLSFVYLLSLRVDICLH